MPDKFTYEIGGKTYTQKAVSAGQIKRLLVLTERLAFHEFTPQEAILLLGDSITTAIAIVLRDEKGRIPWLRIEDGRISVDEERFMEIMLDIEANIDGATQIQALEDFFDCNPIASILERLTGAMEKVRVSIKTGSRISSASSPEEISPGEIKSSGDIQSGNASPISGTEAGK